jgi:hypothetical protein
LKSWPEYFKATVEGSKTFELRKNDRDFKVGDTVVLWEYLPETATLTGQTLVTRITYLLTSGPWLQPGYCCFSFESELDNQNSQPGQVAEVAEERKEVGE